MGSKLKEPATPGAATPETNLGTAAIGALKEHNRGRSPARFRSEELDEHGDAIFRFRLHTIDNANHIEVGELLRQTILDVLQLVKFYSHGKPLIIDAFAFHNEPGKRIRLLTGEPVAGERET
jgi:hypothetical protein